MVRAMRVLSASVRDAGGGDGGKLRDLGIVGAGHADHLGVGAAAADLHPVVFEKLDGDVAVRQELDVVVELARGDGAGAGLFHLDRGAGADGLVEVGGRDVQPVALGLDEKVGQNRDGGFALHHTLRSGKLSHQILAAYGNFHRCPLRGGLLNICFNDRHRPILVPEARCCTGHTLQQLAAMRKRLTLVLLDCSHLTGKYARGKQG